MTMITIEDTDCYYIGELIRFTDNGKLFRVVAVKDNTITVGALRWYEKSWGIVIIITVVMVLLSVGVCLLIKRGGAI